MSESTPPKLDLKPSAEDHLESIVLCKETVKRARVAIENELQLTEAAMDAKRAMEYAVEVWKKDAMEFMTNSDELLKSFRQTRMALEFETRNVKNSINDVLSILMTPDFNAKLMKLNELVTSLERMKTLSESGFLSSVLATISKPDGLTKPNP